MSLKAAYAARDALDVFIYAHYPVAMKLFRPLFNRGPPRGDVTVSAIENSIGMSCMPNGVFIFIEGDGSVLQGDVSRFADTSVGQELTWLESIADEVAGGHDSFSSAFSVRLGNTAKILDKEYKIPLCEVVDLANAIAIIKLRNEYLAAVTAIRSVLPQTLARELAAAVSDNYTFFCRKTEIWPPKINVRQTRLT
jgi:hypothetical protein